MNARHGHLDNDALRQSAEHVAAAFSGEVAPATVPAGADPFAAALAAVVTDYNTQSADAAAQLDAAARALPAKIINELDTREN